MAVSDNDVHDLALQMDNNDVPTVEMDAAAVTGVVEEAAAPVTGVVEDDTTEAEAPVRCAYSDCDSADLASDHLEETGDEEETDAEEEDADDEAEATEGLRHRHTGDVPPPTPTWPPMPTSPLRRQVGASLSPLHGGTVGAELSDHIQLVEAGPAEVAPGDIPVPVWLFLAAIAVLMVYLTVVAYVLSWQCGVGSRR